MNVTNSSRSRCVLWAFTIGLIAAPGRASTGVETNLSPLKYEEPRFLTAGIYAPGADTNLLYKFSRQATRSGKTLQALREYFYPDGRLAARERVVYEGDNLVSYVLEELQIGARGQAQIRTNSQAPARAQILFEYTKDARLEGKAKTNSETFQSETLVNDMLAAFLVSHWDALLKGTEVKCRYMVLPRLETVGFTFRKSSESTWKERPVIILKMEATSPIIAALVEPLFFTVEKEAPHRVLKYVGRTTPKLKSGHKWKDLDAVTIFDWR